MDNHRCFWHVLYHVFFSIFLIVCTSLPTHAINDGSITVYTGTSDGTKLTGMAVSLYKIAEKKADGSWQLMSEYQNLGIDVYELRQADIERIESVAKTQIPSQTMISNQNGIMTFSNLEDAIYLVSKTGEPNLSHDYRASMTAFLVQIPKTESDGSTTNHRQIDASPKCQIYTATATAITVNAEWIDHNNQLGKRPTNIRVILRKGNDYIGEQILNSLNNWSYTWLNLQASDQYNIQIVDEIASYTTSISDPDKTNEVWIFTITNTIKQSSIIVKTNDTFKMNEWLTILLVSVGIILVCFKNIFSVNNK